MDQMYDMKKIRKDSDFLHAWKDQMMTAISRMEPDWDKEDMEKVLNSMIDENLQLPQVILDNNYTGESRNTNMLSVFDWAIRRKPLIAGNATFYKNQHEAINPIAKMLDGFLTERKAIKKRMFAVGEEYGTDTDLYQDLDRAQQNQKILANSYYGGSGMPKSAFYSKWSGPATTSTAQSVISTTETLFEAVLVDNYKFIDLNECFIFMDSVLKQDYEIPKWMVPASKTELFNRLKNMFFVDVYKEEYDEMLQKYIWNLKEDDVTKIFYKNNLVEFTRRHDKVKDLYDEMFSSVKNLSYAETEDDIPEEYRVRFEKVDDSKKKVKEYNSFVNHEFFMDPNSPPDTIIEPLNKIKDYYMKYVYSAFMSIDRIHRLKYFMRKTVCIVDTDSNILALDAWVDFCENEILNGNYGRSLENNRFIIVNSITYFITNAVADTLDTYGKHSNIPDDFRKRFGMKNEFYMTKLVIGKKKKRYISAIRLREGNLMSPYKPDVKGFEFRKATTSEEAKAVFEKIIKNRICEVDVPDIPGIISDLSHFENVIRESIMRREKTYLPLGNAKELEAYKDPYSQQGVRGSLAWNTIYPENSIGFPSKVSILKLNIFDLEDIEELKYLYPKIYDKIKRGIFESPVKEIREKGLQVLAIPSNSDIPEWCDPYIDYNTVINNITGQFKGVTDAFGINCPEVGKQKKTVNRKTKKFSNVVRF